MGNAHPPFQDEGVEHEGHCDGAPVIMAVSKVSKTWRLHMVEEHLQNSNKQTTKKTFEWTWHEVCEDVRSREDGVEEGEEGDLDHPGKPGGLELGGRWLEEEINQSEHQEIRKQQE